MRRHPFADRVSGSPRPKLEAVRRRRGAPGLALEALEARQLLASSVTANPDIYVALQATPLNVAAPGVLGNDLTSSGTGLTVASFTQPADGTLTLQPDGAFQYIPKAGYTGADQFTYVVDDGAGGAATGTVQFTVNATTAEASVFAGPRLVSVDSMQGTLLNTVLGGLVGTNLNLTAADYDGLAAGTINGGRLADALGAELGVTPSQALSTNATLAQIYTAAATVATADGDTADATALTNLATSVSGITAPVQLGNLIQANPNNGSLAGASLNALDLVNGTAQLFNFANVATTPTPITVSGASLGLPGVVTSATISAQVVEPPILTTGPAGTQFHSSAIRLRTDLNLADNLNTTALTTALAGPLTTALGGVATPSTTASLGQLSVYTEVAEGQGTIASIDALANSVTLQATPGLADVYLGNIDPTVFFDRNHVIDPATDLTYGNVGNLNIAASVLGTQVLNQNAGIQVRSVALGAAPTASTEVFNAPFPQSQTVNTSATFLTNLTNSLVNNLSVQLSGSLGTVLSPLINTTILPALTPVVTDAVAPVVTPLLSGVVDPALQQLGTGIGELDLTVNAVNQVAAPAANPDFTTTAEDQAVAVPVLANDATVAGDTITVAAVTQPAHGTAVINPDGTVTYTPTTGYFGPDTFTYTVTDPSGQTSTGTVGVTVVAPTPVGNADTYTAAENTPLTIPAGAGVLSNDTDSAGNPLTAVIDANPTRGTVALNPDGSFTYTPTPGDSGPDTFTYRATDGTNFSAPTTVTVNVQAAPPVTNPDTYTTTAGTTLSVPTVTGVLANDTDPNGLPLTATVATQPAHGTVTLNPDGSLTYVPTAGYVGPDSFTYTANDPDAAGRPALVTINVAAGVPAANPDTYTTTAGTTLSVPTATGVLANDTDPNGLPLTATVATQPAHGTVTLNPDGSLTYVPTAGYVGPDSFTYTASDGTNQSTPTTVALTVNAATTTTSTPTTPTQPPQVVTTIPVTGTVNVPITNAPVVTYTDGTGSTPPGSYTSTINWGGGMPPTTGTVTESNGVYQVSGTQTYPTAGTYPVTVTITSPAGTTTTATTSAVIAPATATASISGHVYIDANNDGLREGTEPGKTGATIILAGTSTAGQPIYYVTHTGIDGSYSFNGLPAGMYALEERRSDRTIQTLATKVVAGRAHAGTLGGTATTRLITGIIVGDGVAGTDYDFAETAVQGIEGTVYLDANKNGVDDSNEFGVANVVLTLTGTTAGGRAVTMTATTDSSGHYAFDDLVTGTYKIKIAAPTSIFNNGRITLGMDGGTVQGESVTGIRYTTGEDVDGYDFGELIKPGCRLNTATVRSLLQVGPNATSLPASVGRVSIPSNGPIAHYLPTLAALATEQTAAASQKVHTKTLAVHAAAVHATAAHAVKVQHGKVKPHAPAVHRSR